MVFVSTRRRVLAGFAALGVGGLPGLARAQDSIPCEVVSSVGTLTNPQPNYRISAGRAEFELFGTLVASGADIVLVAPELAAGTTQATALLRGQISKGADGSHVADRIEFLWPVVALAKDGSLYSLMQMAYDQQVPPVVHFYSGEQAIGSHQFQQGQQDPNSGAFAFTGEAAGALLAALKSEQPFRAEYAVGRDSFASYTLEADAYRAFLNETVATQMAAMQTADETSPCAPPWDEGYGYDDEDYVGCFLTSACCAVVGLADDCWELRMLRRFRDGWMSGFAAGRAEVARYYREAPAVARRLMASAAGRRRLLRLYWGVIVPAALCARLGLNRLAYRLYRRMMVDLLTAG